jgi:ribonuclease HI
MPPGAAPRKAILYTDGAARGNPGPSGAGALLHTPRGKTIDQWSGYLDRRTNNQAEYAGLIGGLEMALHREITELTVRSDSELMVRQMNGSYKVRDETLLELFRKAQQLVQRFERIRFEHVPRERNREADRLANLAIDLHPPSALQ